MLLYIQMYAVYTDVQKTVCHLTLDEFFLRGIIVIV